MLYWTGSIYSYTFTILAWLSAGLALTGLATSFWRRAIALLCFAGCIAIDVLFFVGITGTVSLGKTGSSGIGRRLLGVMSTGIEQLAGGSATTVHAKVPTYVLYYIDAVFAVCIGISAFSFLAAASRPDAYRGPFRRSKPAEPEPSAGGGPVVRIFSALRKRAVAAPAAEAPHAELPPAAPAVVAPQKTRATPPMVV